MKEFFISDLHIGHESCIKFDSRPWSIDEQNENIKRIWNSRVVPEDHVWILGDVLWTASQENVAFLQSLNGKKFLVSGNHDRRTLKSGYGKKLFEEVYEGYHRLTDMQGRTVILSHYPIIQFDGVFRGNIHLYGHIHTNKVDCAFIEKWKKEYEEGQSIALGKPIKVRMYNVGFAVPYMEWGPKTLDEIIAAN